MRSMTGYGRGEADHAGKKISVELNSVNRKQSDIVINLPRDLAMLEPRIRQATNEKVSRGRMNVVVGLQEGPNGVSALALDTALARSYHDAMLTLQKELSAPGEITIGTILQAPGVMRSPEHTIDADDAWPVVQRALVSALGELIKMREREGKHLAKDLIHRLKTLRQEIKEIRSLYPDVVKKYRTALRERLEKAGLDLPQFAHHLRKNEPVGRTLEFITQEIFRELNTLGAKSNDAGISQHVVACKSELEKIREQIQNLE